MNNTRQNLFFPSSMTRLGFPLAAGVLYPLFGILLGTMIAAAAMSLTSVSVIGIRNASQNEAMTVRANPVERRSGYQEYLFHALPRVD
jgi:hypothetical protein